MLRTGVLAQLVLDEETFDVALRKCVIQCSNGTYLMRIVSWMPGAEVPLPAR